MPASRVSPVEGGPTGRRRVRSPGSLPWGLRSLTGDPDRARGVLLPDEAQPLAAAKPEKPAAPAGTPAPRRARPRRTAPPSPRPEPRRLSSPPSRPPPSARHPASAARPTAGHARTLRRRLLQPCTRPPRPSRRPALQPVQPGPRAPAADSAQQRPEDRVGHPAAGREGLPGRRALAPRPEAQERRPVHHAPARRDDDPRRAGHGPGHADGGAAARHGRGHRVRPRHPQARTSATRSPCSSTASPSSTRSSSARRPRPRPSARWSSPWPRTPRPGHQARRPPAQHAHHALPQAREAGEEGPRDAGDLRSAGAPPGHEHHQVGAGGPRLRDPLPQDVRRDRAPGRRARPQARRVPRHSDRRGPVRPARGPHQGDRHRPPEALLQRLPEDDRPRP